MFDTAIRHRIDPWLDRIAARLAAAGMGANAITWCGFAIGMAGALAIVWQAQATALVLILVSRLCDGLDGAVARRTAKTDLGGYLDIVLDFGFYGAVPLAFALADPAANATAAAVLIAAFYFNGASFLAFALLAEKRGTGEGARGSKSLVYTAGLAEGFETIALFVVFCLVPAWFPPLAYAFAALTLTTTAARLALAYRTFV